MKHRAISLGVRASTTTHPKRAELCCRLAYRHGLARYECCNNRSNSTLITRSISRWRLLHGWKRATGPDSPQQPGYIHLPVLARHSPHYRSNPLCQHFQHPAGRTATHDRRRPSHSSSWRHLRHNHPSLGHGAEGQRQGHDSDVHDYSRMVGC